MSLDEMAHCDLYEVESNLKKEACKVHAKLSKLKSQSSSADRILHKPIILNESETGNPLINKDLEEMVNQSKNFPSFNDVLNTVEKANDKYKLYLNDETRKTFAEKSFKIIGKEIKNRRMADFEDIMCSRLPEDFNIEQNDPALHNAEIEKVLSENQREAVVKTEKIFEEYSRIEPNPDDEINIESTEEEPEVTNEPQEMEYDAVDILPPFSSPPESNSNEAKAEISLNDRNVTILSTASLPPRRNDSPSSSITSKECPTLNDNEIIYKLYKQRLTNNQSSTTNNKRPLTTTIEYLSIKKSKQQPEIIVLD